MTASFINVEGRLAPVAWQDLEAFARLMSEFARVHVSPDRVVTVTMDAGVFTLHWSDRMATVALQARDLAAAQNLRDTLGHLLDNAVEGLAAGLQWLDHAVGALPPNFRVARVAARDRISPGFIRLRLAADDIGFMARTGLHLRLLQPQDPSNPDWPRLSTNGRTVWPAPGRLHMPVYTIRAIDAGAGWLDVDIYLHGRGQTCAWAKAACPGDIIGISGPGGGWLPHSSHFVLGGDETALPAIARILASAAPNCTGQAVIMVSDTADRQDLIAPPGVSLHWCDPQDSRDLPATFQDAALAAMARPGGAQILFGGERRVAEELRRGLRAHSPEAGVHLSVAAYWSATAS